MKNYKNLDELLKDYKNALEKGGDDFCRYTLSYLNISPKYLISEFKKHPLAKLINNHGDRFFIWKNNHIKIGNEWVPQEELINKINEFLEDKGNKK